MESLIFPPSIEMTQSLQNFFLYTEPFPKLIVFYLAELQYMIEKISFFPVIEKESRRRKLVILFSFGLQRVFSVIINIFLSILRVVPVYSSVVISKYTLSQCHLEIFP